MEGLPNFSTVIVSRWELEGWLVPVTGKILLLPDLLGKLKGNETRSGGILCLRRDEPLTVYCLLINAPWFEPLPPLCECK